MNMYDIYKMQDNYNDRKQENKRILESSKKQIRLK
jgi:hypothetical protein